MHYRSFEELYGTQTTENHRPSFVNAEAKTKRGRKKSTRTKHTMPFCPFAVCAKNVGITVNCIECEKPRLLFSAKKLSEKDKTILRGFLDTIFYTCSISFHNTCDLATAVLPKQPDIQENDISDEEADDQDREDENEQEPKDTDDEESDNNLEEESDNNVGDSIRELFSRVFINDSWSCSLQVEKPYYSAGIYLDACVECGNLDVTKPAKGEHPRCSDCSDNTINSKKRLRWIQSSKNKQKRIKT